MRFGFGGAAVVAFLATFASVSVTAAEILTLSASEGRFKIMGGMYPRYLVFLKGLDASTIKTAWVDKEYYAVLDVHEGPEAGQSVIMTLKKSTDRSPQPEWCKTEGGKSFEGKGVTCLTGAAGFTEQLRFKVKVKQIQPPLCLRSCRVEHGPNIPKCRAEEHLKSWVPLICISSLSESA